VATTEHSQQVPLCTVTHLKPSLTALKYWDWLDGSDFASSPIFDGSETSMSGDGAYVAHNGSLGGSNNIYLPSGNGGGCLKDGPFKE
jgi:tyrosinase